MPFRYPVSLELEGRRCLVIGGGEVAEHKARGLLEAGARVAVIAPTFTPGLTRMGEAGEMELVARRWRRGDLQGAFLAIAATDDPVINEEIYREAEESGVLLNAVDDNRHCHFAIPSVVRRGDFLLTISTGGKAPALSKRLRRQLSRQFGSEYSELVALLGEVREELLPHRSDFATWASRWQHALDFDLLGLIVDGRVLQARQTVRQVLQGVPPRPSALWDGRPSHTQSEPGPAGGGPLNGNGALSRSGGAGALSQPEGAGVPSGAGGTVASPPRGRVWIVGAGPGDPGLITVRGQEVLDAADVVVYDRLVHPSLVRGRSAVFVGKAPGRHTCPQEEINSLLIRLARVGKKVVRLKGGDPFVFGRGAEEAEALSEAGVEFEVIPGPTSAVAVLAYAGIPVTDRRFASSVAVVTGHCARREVDWRGLATAVDTIVILMGLGSLAEIVRELLAGGRAPETPAAVVQNGTLPAQRVVTAPLRDLPEAVAAAGLGTPAIIVVGEVVGLRERIGWFRGADSVRHPAAS